MKTPKLIKRVEEFLDSNKNKQCEEKKCLKEILRKLKKNEKILQERLKKEKDEKKQKSIKKSLDIIYAQRKKGIRAMKKKG